MKGMLSVRVWPFVGAAILTTAAGWAAAAATPAPTARQATAAIPTLKLKCGSPLPRASYTSAMMDFFTSALTELSGGKITSESYYAAALFSFGEEPGSLGKGLADCGVFSTNYSPGVMPVTADGVSLGWAFTYEMAADLANLPTIGDIVREETSKNAGFITIAGTPAVVPFFLRKLPPKGFLADPPNQTFKDMRISAAATYGEFAKAFGGTVVSIPSQEIALAYRTGQLDANFTSYDSWLTIKDEAPVVYRQENIIPLALGFNTAKFNSLSPQVRQLILRAGLIASQKSAAREKERVATILAELKNPKYIIVQPTQKEREAWISTMRRVQWDKFAAKGAKQAKWVETIDKLQREGYTPSWQRGPGYAPEWWGALLK